MNMNMNIVHMHGMVNFQVSILQYYISVLSILHVDRSVNSRVHAWGIFVAMHEDTQYNLIPRPLTLGLGMRLDHVASY